MVLCEKCSNYEYCFDRDFPHPSGCDHFRTKKAAGSEATNYLLQITLAEMKTTARAIYRFLPNLIVYEMDQGIFAARINSAVILIHANDLQDAKKRIDDYLTEKGAI